MDAKIGKIKDEPYENIMITADNNQKNNEKKQNSQDNNCPCN